MAKPALQKSPGEVLADPVPSADVEGQTAARIGDPPLCDPSVTEGPSAIKQDEALRDRDEKEFDHAAAKADFQRKINALSEERDKAVAELERAREELAAKIEELTGREAAAPTSAVSSGDEKLATITRQLENIVAERDELLNDLARTRKELAERVEQIESQQKLHNQNREEAATEEKKNAEKDAELERLRNEIEALRKGGQEAERDALQKNLVAKDAEIEGLKIQLAAFGKGGDEKLATLISEHAFIVAELQRVQHELAGRDENIAFQQELNAKSAEDAARLVSDREVLRKELSTKSSELEALRIELNSLRQGGGRKDEDIAAERDKLLADLKRAREELGGSVEQVELQQSLARRSVEEAAKLAVERDVLQRDLAEKAGALEELKAEIGLQKKNHAEQQTITAKEREEIAGERDRVISELEQVRRDLGARVAEFEVERQLAMKTARELEESKTALTKANDEQAAMEKQLGERASEIDTLKAQLAELETGRREIAGKMKQLEFQENLINGDRTNATKATSEQGPSRQELAGRMSEIAALTRELASLKLASDEKLSALARERDALVQQKSSLTEQLTAATANLATRKKTGVGVELSKKENQRQIEELQRRIMAFESSQKERAQELSRERETRIKAERSLAAAERARQEATALIESLRVETRREYEAAARKRDAEFARAQQELQEKLAALTEGQRKALSERDELAAAIQKLRKEPAATSTAAQDSLWESRAVASLEADIANYRERIKTLLQEKDAAASAAQTKIETLMREREEAARELERTAARERPTSEQTRTDEDLLAKATALEEKEAQQTAELAAARDAAQSNEATVAQLRCQLEKLTAERDNVQTDWEKLFVELEAVRAQAQEQREKFRQAQAELENRVAEAERAANQRESAKEDVIQTPREPREANVIDITTAEMAAPCETDSGINLQRIHPPPIPPPNVRIL